MFIKIQNVTKDTSIGEEFGYLNNYKWCKRNITIENAKRTIGKDKLRFYFKNVCAEFPCIPEISAFQKILTSCNRIEKVNGEYFKSTTNNPTKEQSKSQWILKQGNSVYIRNPINSASQSIHYMIWV